MQARKVGGKPGERTRYVECIPGTHGDEHAVGLELERGRRRMRTTRKDSGERGKDAGGGRRGGDELGQRRRGAIHG